ncbi:MAG: hypothetical protein ABIO70_13175 [Pseudomonadota bacterium]
MAKASGRHRARLKTRRKKVLLRVKGLYKVRRPGGRMKRVRRRSS